MQDQTRVPRQKRAMATKRHIIETAIGLFSQKGYHHTSSNEIARQAGVSIGCFYSYFKDKKQLFLEALNHFDQQIQAGMETDLRVNAAEKDRNIYGFIRNTIQAHKIFPGFHREVEAMRILDPDIEEASRETEKKEIRNIRGLLEMWKEELAADDLDTASVLLYHTVERIVHVVLFSETDVREENLIRELTDMILRYLF